MTVVTLALWIFSALLPITLGFNRESDGTNADAVYSAREIRQKSLMKARTGEAIGGASAAAGGPTLSWTRGGPGAGSPSPWPGPLRLR